MLTFAPRKGVNIEMRGVADEGILRRGDSIFKLFQNKFWGIEKHFYLCNPKRARLIRAGDRMGEESLLRDAADE